MPGDPDDTIRIRVDRARPESGRPAGPRRRPVLPWIAAGALVAATAGAGTWWLWPHPADPTPVQRVALAAPDPAPAPSEPAETSDTTRALSRARDPLPQADEAQILADAPDLTAIYRFAPRPAVVVMQFASLADQAHMFNRVAALVEKNGFPHDQVLPRATLDARIQAEGGSPDTFYYGHDYRAADVMRFFDLAIDINPDEQKLRDLVHRLGWRDPAAVGAIVSLVRASSAKGLDDRGRAAILRHELSHGVYFTDPAYAAYSQKFWRDALTAAERARFTAFLASEGYDVSLEDLVINETQAYLMHTPDRRFFDPNVLGLSPTRVVELRQVFLVGMPPGWLRDNTGADAP